MIFGSVCSGIEAASVAWHPLGWRPAFFSEIEAFPRAVLKERWPGVPIHGDFTTIRKGDYEPIELLVGGTPCQDFSVAGLRAGLAGNRGNLTLEFVHLARRLRPAWLVWENVPGVLSSDDGRAFGLFLGALGECGYGFAWRVLDAQYFGVPQRRRRVFVVGYLGDWRVAAAVLFEPESLRGDPAPRREAGERVARELAPCIGASGRGFERTGDPRGQDRLIAFGGNNTAGPIDVATARNAHGGPHGRLDFESETFVTHAPEIANCLSPGGSGGGQRGNYRQASGSDQVIVTHSLRADGFDASEDGTGRSVPLIAVTISNASHTLSDIAGTLSADTGCCQPMPLTLAIRGRGDSHDLEYRDDGIANAILTPNGGRAGIGVGAVAFHGTQDPCVSETTAFALGRNSGQENAALQGMSVRRLTPRECERLQGFPDDYTLVSYRGKPATDGPRYRALGNSMAVPCMRWIGERIQLVTDTMTMELVHAAE